MKLNTLKRKIKNIRPGVYTRIVYEVDCPVKAEYKKEGVKIRKHVCMTARFGIRYGNIKSVLERSSEHYTSKPSNFTPIVENYIYYNTNTQKHYLNVYTIKNSHTKTIYHVYKDNKWTTMVRDEVKDSELVIPSYFEKTKPEMFRISIENVMQLGNRR